MALEAQLKADLKTAMKAREALRVSTIKMLIADLQNQLIAASGAPLDPDAELALLSRQAKRRREAIAAYEQGGRQELADQEAAELAIIEDYLPKQLQPDEVRAIIAEIVREIVRETGATGKRDMGKVMGKLMPKVKGRFPGGEVKALVDEALAEG